MRKRVGVVVTALALACLPTVHPQTPLPPDQTTPRTERETRAIAAESEGRLREAFDSWSALLADLPESAPVDDDRRIREALVRLAPRLDPPPPLPEEVERLTAFGQNAFAEANDTVGFEKAAEYFRRAARLAPWQPAIAFNLALVQEKLEQWEPAIANLRVYLASEPADAAEAKRKLFDIEYRRDTPVPLVYFLLPGMGGITMEIAVDGVPTARLQSDRYFAMRLTPGKHLFTIRVQARMMGMKMADEETPPAEYPIPAQRVVYVNLGKRDKPDEEMLKRCRPLDARDVLDPARVVFDPPAASTGPAGPRPRLEPSRRRR